tara:strand:- start:1136 stop:1321 length:186 start_codon:yes stop_codon:yes gene_type:complete
MKREPFTPKFLAEQVAGSMRISGFRVSSERQAILEAIIKGDLDPEMVRREIIERHLKKASS